MDIDAAENGGGALRRHACGFGGEGLQAIHLGGVKQVAIAGPTLDAFGGADFIPAAALTDDFEFVAMVRDGDRSRLDVDIFVEIQASGAGVSDANGRGLVLLLERSAGKREKREKGKRENFRPGNHSDASLAIGRAGVSGQEKRTGETACPTLRLGASYS